MRTGCRLFLCAGIVVLQGQTFGSFTVAKESHSDWERIERPDAKDVNASLLHISGSEFSFPMKHKKMSGKGLTYVAFSAMSAKEFRKSHVHELPGVSDRKAFRSGLIIRLTGTFLARDKREGFFSPEYQLRTDVVEAIGRKVRVVNRLPDFKIEAYKTIKSNKILSGYSTGSGSVNSFDLAFKMGACSWHFHQSPADRWEGWGSTKGEPFPVESLASLNQHLTAFPGLKKNNLPGVRDPFSGQKLNFPDHVVTTFTEPHPDEKIINGSHFVTSVYNIPDKPYSLVITRWYVSVNQKDLVKRFVGSGLATFVSALSGIFGPVGVTSFVEHTVMRDYARLVDAVRSFKADP